ncbi:hypothetical protein KUTeg_011037 [Tegillarca granosa]|uniref:Uncharacterized protein n=1 Tax=Tegillarca granosa TaxID=220873 RepID=A0ABQ9F734_TEGGR|nr:hypothetical protein KUTeg_011037 [Tegillarca granosa]
MVSTSIDEESRIYTISDATTYYPPHIKNYGAGIANQGFDKSNDIQTRDSFANEQEMTSEKSSQSSNAKQPNTAEKEQENVSGGGSSSIPDGGWGWVVCLCSIMSQGAAIGIMNLFGVIFVQIIKEFGEGDPSASFKACK